MDLPSRGLGSVNTAKERKLSLPTPRCGTLACPSTELLGSWQLFARRGYGDKVGAGPLYGRLALD